MTFPVAVLLAVVYGVVAVLILLLLLDDIGSEPSRSEVAGATLVAILWPAMFLFVCLLLAAALLDDGSFPREPE